MDVIANPYHDIDTTKPQAEEAKEFTEAVLYARTSPRPQPTEASLQKQLDDCQRKADEKGLYVVKSIVDDKRSGKKLAGRPGLQEALDIVIGRQGVLIAYDLARVSRSMIEVFKMAEDIEAAGAALLTVSGPQVDTTSPFSKVVFRMAAVINEYFREQQGILTAEAMAWRKQQGMIVGKPPYGWVRGEDGRAQPHPGQQRMIRWLIWRRHNGASYGWCIAELEARGFQRLDNGRYSKEWVRKIVSRNEPLFGVMPVELDWYDCLVNYLLARGECWPMVVWKSRPPILLHRALVPDMHGEWPHAMSCNDLPAMDVQGRLCMPLAEIRRLTEALHKVGTHKPGTRARKEAEGKVCLPASENDVPELLRSGFQWRPVRTGPGRMA